jgi:hypothetical protein
MNAATIRPGKRFAMERSKTDYKPVRIEVIQSKRDYMWKLYIGSLIPVWLLIKFFVVSYKPSSNNV